MKNAILPICKNCNQVNCKGQNLKKTPLLFILLASFACQDFKICTTGSLENVLFCVNKLNNFHAPLNALRKNHQTRKNILLRTEEPNVPFFDDQKSWRHVESNMHFYNWLTSLLYIYYYYTAYYKNITHGKITITLRKDCVNRADSIFPPFLKKGSISY